MIMLIPKLCMVITYKYPVVAEYAISACGHSCTGEIFFPLSPFAPKNLVS